MTTAFYVFSQTSILGLHIEFLATNNFVLVSAGTEVLFASSADLIAETAPASARNKANIDIVNKVLCINYLLQIIIQNVNAWLKFTE